jgi:cell division protein FtsL
MFTLAIAVLVPLSLLLYNNSRITDVRSSITDAKETLRAEIKSEIGTLRAEMRENHLVILASLERIAAQVKALETNLENRIKIHELEHPPMSRA